MANKEWVIDLVILMIGVAFAIESSRLGLGGIHRPGAGFLPFYTGLGLSLVAIFSLLKNFWTVKREMSKERKKLFGRSVYNVAAIVFALIVYALIFQWLGYLISTFLLLIFLFKAGGFRRWTFTLVAAFLTVSFSYLLFCFWLNMRFPKGFLGF